MPVVLLTATTATLLLHVATKWTAYGRGTVAQYRKYSWGFQARAPQTCTRGFCSSMRTKTCFLCLLSMGHLALWPGGREEGGTCNLRRAFPAGPGKCQTGF